MAKIYEHQYLSLSVYGNVVSLLRDQVTGAGVHLDIGCGYGAIAEPVRDELGLTYLGFDIAEDGLDSLRGRGFEVRKVDLANPMQAEAIIREAVGDRPIASLTFMDTLEHITNGADALAMLRSLADRYAAPLVLSVPNVTHKDIALKLLIGRWDVTEAGLLDHTHVAFYNHVRLSRLMDSVGWREVAARDWLLEHSDQQFPLSAPILNPKLPVGNLLRRLVDQANPDSTVNQFVRMYRIERPKALQLFEERTEPAGPFLSVITRTQGTRIRTLRDVLMSLAGQSCQDFELLVVVHSETCSADKSVHALVAEFPATFRQRVRLLTCTRPGRTAPLNDALREVKGQYVAVLDDDDFVFGHWVETFRRLACEAPGAMLRAVCTRQDFELASSNGGARRPRATSWFQMQWPTTYDAVAHLYANFTPFMSIAFPAAVFHSLGLRLDESLSTTEDWDLGNRVAMLCGVVTTPEVTSVYRWWTNAESSSFLHTREEWDANRQQILQKLNSQPILLPPGSVTRINKLAERNEWMCQRLLLTGITVPWSDASDQLQEFSKQLLRELVKSRSWRWTRSLRKVIQVLRRRGGSGLTIDEIPSSFADCQRLMREVRDSSSWRLTRPLRAIGRIF